MKIFIFLNHFTAFKPSVYRSYKQFSVRTDTFSDPDYSIYQTHKNTHPNRIRIKEMLSTLMTLKNMPFNARCNLHVDYFKMCTSVDITLMLFVIYFQVSFYFFFLLYCE